MVIRMKINVSDITKERLYKGEKGLYLSATLVPTPNSEYSDYMIVEDVSKEERQAGEKGVILGNAKVFETESKPSEKDLDDLPF